MKPFLIPCIILLIAFFGFVGSLPYLYLTAIAIGLVRLVWESIEKIREGRWSLDYIAILAMTTSLVSPEYYLAGAIVALMITLSGALEGYGAQRAEASLKALIEKLPKVCQVKQGSGYQPIPIQEVTEGSIIFLKTNELIPLDGFLGSAQATIDTANLTGESLPVELTRGEFIKSGSVNIGAAFELTTTGTFSTSSYQKIIALVEESKRHPARTVRLAQKFNWPFTAITLVLAAVTYGLTRDLSRTLAVLAIATPCPLLISAPIAFLGGMSKAAKQTVIIKKPAVLETLARATTIYLDKTGTLTLGQPILVSITVLQKTMTETKALSIAAAIEMHSLHPLARTIVAARSSRKAPEFAATQVQETIGVGISGVVQNERYTISKSNAALEGGINIDLLAGTEPVARFTFTDQVKENANAFLADLAREYKVAIITGDSEANAERLFGGYGVKIYARATPEKKFDIVKSAQANKECVIMVGDGLNDAPALAMADAGIVFSGTENSASIEAASVAILSHDILLVSQTLALSKRTTSIALQSISIGIGLSLIGMGFAAAGFITPVLAATIQELIDVGVTLNALRSAR